MQYNFVLIRTDKGGRYARKILNSIKWINEHKYPEDIFIPYDLTISEFMNDNYFDWTEMNPETTIIHARCANPRTEWTIKLRELEDAGHKVVNSVDTIELTSNKLACSLHLQGKVNHPRSWEWNKNWTGRQKDEFIAALSVEIPSGEHYIIAKPYTSLEQGANVKKINLEYTGFFFENRLRNAFDSVPGNKIVIQEYIPYTALHRVIVIGGKALPYTFVDYANDPRKTDWKVSCCLNRTTMKLNENANPELLELAEKTQKEVGGVINFIDIFEYNKDHGDYEEISAYTNAEINTACSLNIHERLAKQAGRSDWNIHYRIGKCLVEKLLND